MDGRLVGCDTPVSAYPALLVSLASPDGNPPLALELTLTLTWRPDLFIFKLYNGNVQDGNENIV